MNCPYCETKAKFFLRTKDFNRKINNKDFNYYKCKKCHLIFLNPVPPDLGRYYPKTYHHIPNEKDFLKNNSLIEQYKIDIIKNFKSHGNLLEIGSSLGTFLYLASREGFNVSTIEMDKYCCEFISKNIRANVVNSNDILKALENLGNFDVICLWHVLEHLIDGLKILELIVSKLNKGGCLVLATPNPKSFQFKIMNRLWPHIDAPRHVYLIPHKLLISKMRNLGMDVLFLTTKDKGSLGWNFFGWEFFFGKLNNKSIKNIFLRILGRSLAFILQPIERIEGLGSAYTIVFKKNK